VCSPAKAVRWSEDADGLSARLSEVLIVMSGEDNCKPGVAGER